MICEAHTLFGVVAVPFHSLASGAQGSLVLPPRQRLLPGVFVGCNAVVMWEVVSRGVGLPFPEGW